MNGWIHMLCRLDLDTAFIQLILFSQGKPYLHACNAILVQSKCIIDLGSYRLQVCAWMFGSCLFNWIPGLLLAAFNAATHESGLQVTMMLLCWHRWLKKLLSRSVILVSRTWQIWPGHMESYPTTMQTWLLQLHNRLLWESRYTSC